MLAHLGHQLMLFANFVLTGSAQATPIPLSTLPLPHVVVCLVETSFLPVSLCCSQARADTFRFFFFSASGSHSTICSYILSVLSFLAHSFASSPCLFLLFFCKFFFIAWPSRSFEPRGRQQAAGRLWLTACPTFFFLATTNALVSLPKCVCVCACLSFHLIVGSQFSVRVLHNGNILNMLAVTSKALFASPSPPTPSLSILI